MKKKKLSITALLFLAATTWVSAQTVTRTSQGVKAEIAGEKSTVEVSFYTPSIVRVVKYPSSLEQKPDIKSLSVILFPEQTKFSTKEQNGQVTLQTSNMTVVLDTDKGTLRFADNKKNTLLVEQGSPVIELHQDGADKGDYRVRQAWKLDKDEAIYGLGQLQTGKMSQRNQTKHMIQGNTEDFVTFFQSVKGYGLFWDNYSPTTFTDDEAGTSFDSEVGECIDYYFMYGGNADGVIAQMRTLTGQVPMFPLWSYGYFQCKERYRTQNELVGVVRKYRELNVPLDGIIQDWQYWGSNYLWNAMEFLNPDYYNAPKMINDVHKMNARFMISIWSSFGPMTHPYRELEAGNMLFNMETYPQVGPSFWYPEIDYPSGVRVYDPFNPKARDIYWKHLNKGLFSLGVDGWWMDCTEPDHFVPKEADFDAPTYLGTFRKMRNAFPLMTVGGVYDHQRATTNDKRVFIMTRSAFAGQQRYGANTWTGDVQSSWRVFKLQIPAGLNFSLCGIPHWNTDIGGFYLGGSYTKGLSDMDFRELTVRWTQFGTFCPMMRSHGTDVPREIYQFGKKGEPYYDAIEKYINLRYSLLPYIYSTSWEVTNRQSTFMRALAMDFVHDKNVWDMNNEYMFGKSFLVVPVTDPMYTKMEGDNRVSDFSTVKTTKVYLPSETLWYDFWTNETFEGGQTIQKETPLDILPLYVRAGSIIPRGPKVQYATEKSWDNLQIDVYPGADGTFCLYEDEFDNYNYEKGARSEITFTWNDARRTLTIGACKGEYEGMITNRLFVVKTVDGQQKYVVYDGRKVTVKL